MKITSACLLIFTMVWNTIPGYAQNIGVGNAAFTPNASSMLEVQSNGNKGLLIPRMNNAQRLAMNPLPQAAQGLLVYQTNVVGASQQGFYYNTSTTTTPNWLYLASDGSDWKLAGNSASFLDFLGTTNNMQLAIRTNNVQRMVFTSTGRIGIGIAFPSVAFHVNGTVRFGSLAGAGNRPVMADAFGTLFTAAAGTGDWMTTGNTGTLSSNFIGTTDNQSFKIRTNNAQRAVVLNDGRFLVGTTAALGNFVFQGKANSTNRSGVYGESINASNSYGVHGKGITSGLGVYGESSNRAGVVGAIIGTAPKYYSGNSAVAGTGPNVGVFGASTNLTLNAGVLGFGNNLSAGSLNTDGAGVAGIGSKIGVFGQSLNTGTNPISAAGGYFVQGAAFAYLGVRQITPNINFKIVGSGSVSTIVRDENENPVLMFAPEAPEVLFQDYGTGKLINGFAHIDIDPIFAKNIHVDETHPLRVYIQPEGDCKGVFVLNKTGNSFEVRELGGGNSSINFSYMVIGNRADEKDLDTEYTKARFPKGPEALPLQEIKAVKDKE